LLILDFSFMRSLRRSIRRNWPLLLIGGTLLLAALCYAVFEPLLRFWLSSANASMTEGLARLDFLETIRWRALMVFVLAWFFMLGGAIGSYLNVVVWRTPRGMSVASGGSKCPYCRTAIHRGDNVPVFGWLRLRGRCRACRLPISPRYPIVEAIVASVFLSLAIVEILCDGLNLPGRIADPQHFGLEALLLERSLELFAIFAFHATLLVLLLGAGLILYDGYPIPWSYSAFAFIVGVATPLLYGVVYPLPWGISPKLPPVANPAMTLAVGVAAGVLLGCAFYLIARVGNASSSPGGVILAFVYAGMFLGWQGAVFASLLALGLLLLTRGVGQRLPAPLLLFAGTWAQILCWRWLNL